MSQSFEPHTAFIKLHPSSPLFIFIEAIVKIIFPLVVTFFVSGSYFFQQGWFVAGLALFATIGTVVQYWFYRYWLEPDRIVVKSGILFKELRQVPYERIQNINIKSTVLHKLFKVVTVQIESASGSKPEAVIRVVGLSQLSDIQQAIKNNQTTDPSSAPESSESEQPEEAPLFTMTSGDITRYGCIHWQALVPLAAIFGLAMQSEAMRDQLSSYILSMVFYIRNFTGLHGKLLNGLVLVLMILLAAWLLSMVIAHLKLHGFTLKKERGKLLANMGLLTNLSANIPIKRIQLLRIRESFMHRALGRQTLTMETAGGVTEQTGIVMRWLAPLAKPEQLPPLVQDIEPRIDLNQTQWQPLSHKAKRRLFKKTAAILLTVIALPTFFWRNECAWLLLSAPLWWWYASAWARFAAFAHNEHYVAFRSGVLFRGISLVKINKIQTIHLTESPFDRRNNHGGLWVDTAGSNIALHHINIPYLDKTQLLKMHQQLTRQVSHSQFVW